MSVTQSPWGRDEAQPARVISRLVDGDGLRVTAPSHARRGRGGLRRCIMWRQKSSYKFVCHYAPYSKHTEPEFM
jgi:hypothetical protein